MAVIEVENLKLYFMTRRGPAKAVDNIGFSIEKKETLGLIGESGCGKTTTAMALMKFVKPPGQIIGGSIRFMGSDIVPMTDEQIRQLRGKEISIVRQEAQNALNPVLTIGRQITEMILEHESVTRETALARAKKQLNLVGISDQRINSYPHEFSGGMKQRAMAAIATACNPKFLILDEPTTGLDVVVQRQILMMLRDLKDELDLTAVFISHDLSVVAETCDRVAVMYAGKIMEESDAVSLYKAPLHPYSKALIRAYPSLKGERRQLKSIPGAPPSLIDPPPGCRFAPRCELAQDICSQEEPAVNTIDGRRVACHMVK
ncbi:MAG: ABC transporter ATP-binding protein [Deltaproteobacteria bacterium]|nr:MAG: ABC transporter ATP-binding protein [Deltaproteobacteria bacterium]